MKNNIALFIILIVLTVSCSKEVKRTGKYRTIALLNTENIHPLSNYVSDVNYIELKYPTEIAPGKIEDIKLLDNDIIVKQRYLGKTTFIRFSSKGDFLNKIGEISRSEDIQDPRDITTYNNDFAVWGESGVHVFTKDDDYQRKIININQTGDSFFYTGNKFFFFHEAASPGYLSEYSISGKLDKVFHPVNEELENSEYSTVAEVAKDQYHLFSPLNDTVFAFSNNDLTPEYVFESETYPTYIQLLKNIDSMDQSETKKYMNNNQHWLVTNYLENRDFIFIVYRLGSNAFNLIIRKSDWKTSYVKKLINNIDGGIWDDPYYLSANNQLYIPLRSGQIAGHKILNKYHHEFDTQIEMAQQSDNPVLMVCKLK